MQFNTRSSAGPLQQLGFRDPEGQHEPPVSTAVSRHSGTPLSRAESDTPGTGHTHHPLATPRGSVSWLSLARLVLIQQRVYFCGLHFDCLLEIIQKIH